MARAQPVEIGGHHFDKKDDALAFMKSMLNRYRPGATVSDVDSAFLTAALKYHPESLSKLGPGPRKFEVRKADYGTQCFWIIRLDGTEERFSYKSCV